MTPAESEAMLAQWAASGLMRLTGTPDAALGPPAPLVPGVVELGAAFPGIDALALLGERAALLGLGRHGTTSCGGGCRLVRAADGWIAVSLARPEDFASLPAWLECAARPRTDDDAWKLVTGVVSTRAVVDVCERGRLLGLPIAAVGEAMARQPVKATALGSAPGRAELDNVTVVDLTALWAGPLCGQLLAHAGASVIKVESTHRPDGARRGPAEFFDVLNGPKRSVALDLSDPGGVRLLAALLRRADVVLESSRPRALEQLGIRAADLVSDGGPRLWVSITGYGRHDEAAERVAFGDDAAAAGGLLCHDGDQPRFCADAIADPLSGLTAAGAVLDALAGGGRWLLDVAMAAVAADLAGPTLPLRVSPTTPLEPAPPRARPVLQTAPALGADTARVLEEFGLNA